MDLTNFYNYFTTSRSIWGSISGKDEKFLLLQNVQTGMGGKPSLYSMGRKGLISPVAKGLKRKTDLSFSFSTEFKNEWISTSTSTMYFMVCRRTKLLFLYLINMTWGQG
jgi:hypothetical protein